MFAMTLIMASAIMAKDYHVAKTGNDTNSGTFESPLLTIQAAANLAQAGDIITVHEGIYRERITPPRGGESDTQRIIYQAAPGEKVEVKGSEVVKNWVKHSLSVWKVTIPNSFFSDYNPYKDLVNGDWFNDKGRIHHTGEVYLNGKSLWEMESLKKVRKSEPFENVYDSKGSTFTWYCESDNKNTTIYANFQEADPNKELVEINVRKACFYPEETGINYITLRGFYMSQTATQWAPPTAEQMGLIGTNWSKGWIIENNVIRNSKCSGITLGKYGDEYDNKSEDSAEGYVETIKRALAIGWSKENIGSHIIRNNTISDCEQTGICGSMGGIFSTIENNNIYNIYTKRMWTGAEMGGIKIHASIDMLIKNNRVVNTNRGIWMDWMAQGTRITSNLCYNNDWEDIFCEVNHGPYLVDNNLFLSLCSVWDMSQGGAYVHNLIAGKLNMSPHVRITPYHNAHVTEISGYHEILGGDDRFFNNIFLGENELNIEQEDIRFFWRTEYGKEGFGLGAYRDAALPVIAKGNVYLNGAVSLEENSNELQKTYKIDVKIEETTEGTYFEFVWDEEILKFKNRIVTTEILGETSISKLPFVHPDDSEYNLDRDYSGKKRDKSNTVAGPFKIKVSGKQRIKVW
jgi:hypothetical protein